MADYGRRCKNRSRKKSKIRSFNDRDRIAGFQEYLVVLRKEDLSFISSIGSTTVLLQYNYIIYCSIVTVKPSSGLRLTRGRW